MPFPKVKSHELAIRQRLLSDDNSQTHYAPGIEIDRASSRAHSAQGALWPLSRELPRWKRDHGLLHGKSRKTPLSEQSESSRSETGSGCTLRPDPSAPA